MSEREKPVTEQGICPSYLARTFVGRCSGKAEAIASAERKSQVRTVDRSERIRTYNFPENRISDHRVNYKSNNLDAVLNGDLDDMIQTLLDADKAARLANAN